MYQLVIQCDYCREDMNRKCREVHPEWDEYKDDDKITDYVNENTPKVMCLVFLDEDGHEAFCPKHLRCIAEDIETGSCSCFKEEKNDNWCYCGDEADIRWDGFGGGTCNRCGKHTF